MNSRKALGISSIFILIALSMSSGQASVGLHFQKSIQSGGSCNILNQVVIQSGYRYTCNLQFNSKIWVVEAISTPPYFVKQNVLQFTSDFAPKKTNEYIVLWNGEDIHGIAYPAGTKTSVRVDGVDSNYLVTPAQPITLFLPNVMHKFVLIALVPKLKAQISSAIAVAPLDLTLLTNGSVKDVGLTPPVLNCSGSGEKSGAHPGWSSVSAVKLTNIEFGSGSHALFWCPAAAPNGSGNISYTVTATPNGYTCETRQLSCLIVGLAGKFSYQISATDETGTYYSGLATVRSSGLIPACIPAPLTCNIANALTVFHSYGNVPPTSLGNCTFAAIANWEHLVFGVNPNSTQLLMQFSQAGGNLKSGITDAQTFDYWHKTPITGLSLVSSTPYPPDPEDIRTAIDNPRIIALLASLHAQKGQYLGDIMFTTQTFHWIVVDGYTQRGPLIVTWGQTIQMTWQQWNREVGTVWKVVAKSI